MGVQQVAPSPLKRPEFRRLLAISITVAIGFGMIVPVLPLYARSFGVSLTAIGLVQLVFGLTRFSFGIVGGLAVDRFGERASTVAGLLIVTVSSFAMGLADSFPQLVAARGIGGAGSALFVAGLMNRILRMIEPEAMGRATSASRASFLVGIGVGPVLGGYLAQLFGLTAPFYFYGLALLIATVVAWFVLGAPAEGGPTTKRRPLDALRAAQPLFGDLRYVVALAVTFAGWWTISGPAQTIGAVFAEEHLGFTRGEVGFAITLLAVGEIAALAVAGWAADRFGRRSVLVPSLAMIALGVAFIGQIDESAVAFYAGMVVVGGGIAASGAAAGGLLGDAIPRGGSGAAVGVNQMSGDLGYLISPVAMGALAEGGDFEIAYSLAAIPAAAVLLFSLRLPGRGGRGAAEVSVEPAEPVG